MISRECAYPLSTLLCSFGESDGASIRKQPLLGLRFMRAYIRGCRYYVAALMDGKIEGANAENVVKIMTEFSSEGNLTVCEAIDASYVRRALKSLPPYRGAG